MDNCTSGEQLRCISVCSYGILQYFTVIFSACADHSHCDGNRCDFSTFTCMENVKYDPADDPDYKLPYGRYVQLENGFPGGYEYFSSKIENSLKIFYKLFEPFTFKLYKNRFFF